MRTPNWKAYVLYGLEVGFTLSTWQDLCSGRGCKIRTVQGSTGLNNYAFCGPVGSAAGY